MAENLISAINERKSYTVHIQDKECAQWTVTNISGISSANQELVDAIGGGCELITTSIAPCFGNYQGGKALKYSTLKSRKKVILLVFDFFFPGRHSPLI